MTRREHKPHTRAEQAFLDVLPPSVRAEVVADVGPDFIIAGHRLRVDWVGEGHLGDVRRVLGAALRPDVVVGRHLSPGARAALSQAGLSWVDETGAAEVALGTLVISRTGRPPAAQSRPARWTPATLAVAESLLCGIQPTVSSTQEATGLSTGSCTTALRTLTDLGFLEADAARGRAAGRRVRDPDVLLSAYVTAAVALRPLESLQLGVTWRDPVAALAEFGHTWAARGVRWCATGAVAAAVLAPHLTTIGTSEVYVDANTVAGLEAVAAEIGLKPMEGGRLTLRPIPTHGVRRLASEIAGLWVAPWPRVYVDLRNVGVRGEEAAEHLLEVLHGRRS